MLESGSRYVNHVCTDTHIHTEHAYTHMQADGSVSGFKIRGATDAKTGVLMPPEVVCLHIYSYIYVCIFIYEFVCLYEWFSKYAKDDQIGMR